MSEEKVNYASEVEILDTLLNTDDALPSKRVLMPRFGVHFEIQALDGKKIRELRKRCEYPIKERGATTMKTDSEKFNALLIVAGCKLPDWNHPDLLAKYKASDGGQVVMRRLLAGEIDRLGDEILEISGYYEDGNDPKN